MVVFSTIEKKRGIYHYMFTLHQIILGVSKFLYLLLQAALFWNTLLIAEGPALIMRPLGRSCFLLEILIKTIDDSTWIKSFCYNKQEVCSNWIKSCMKCSRSFRASI